MMTSLPITPQIQIPAGEPSQVPPPPACLPNTNNNPKLDSKDVERSNSSLRNFLKGLGWPPSSGQDRAKMRAAIEAFKAQIKKTKETSAKKVKPKRPTTTTLQPGISAITKAIDTITAQEEKIGNQLPGIANYLPPNTDLSKTSWAEAIKMMEDTVKQTEVLLKNPSGQTLAPAGTLTRGTTSTTVSAPALMGYPVYTGESRSLDN